MGWVSQKIEEESKAGMKYCLGFDFDLPTPFKQAEESVICTGYSAKMSEWIMLFIIREFRSSRRYCD